MCFLFCILSISIFKYLNHIKLLFETIQKFCNEHTTFYKGVFSIYVIIFLKISWNSLMTISYKLTIKHFGFWRFQEVAIIENHHTKRKPLNIFYLKAMEEFGSIKLWTLRWFFLFFNSTIELWNILNCGKIFSWAFYFYLGGFIFWFIFWNRRKLRRPTIF